MSVRVPGVGPRDAAIALIGEAPAREEERSGEPFVGTAGRQLDRMLLAAGLKRADIYITNVIKHSIPQGDAKDGFFFAKKQPSQEYMEGILELLEELKGRHNVLVPLGNYALWALTQQTGIMNWRGSIMESTLLPGQKLVPTLHPAYYVQEGYYNSNKEALGIWDLQRAKEESKSPIISLPNPDYIVSPTSSQIDEAVDRLLAADHMTVDTEWYGPEDLAYVGFTDSPEWAICVPATSLHALRAIRLLLSSDVPKILQNAMFDAVALARGGIEVRAIAHDTMIAWHNCWGDIAEKSLQVIGSVLTRHPFYKDELSYVGKGDERGQIYNCRDCVVTDEAWKKINGEELDYTHGRAGYEIVRQAMPIFIEAAKRGIRGDRQKMEELGADALAKADYIEKVLSDTVGHTINCRSSQQVQRLVYDELGVKRKVRTTKQETLMDIAAATSDEQLKTILTAVIRVRQNRNIVSRYLTPEQAIDRDGRIRTDWKLAGTRGGARFSSGIFGKGESRWFPSVAIQTVPDEARVCYIADPGTVFVGWDMEQAEARVVAVKTRDYDLLDDLANGIDIHAKLTAMLPFGYTYEEVIEQVRLHGKERYGFAPRYLAKKCRHGFNYRMGSGIFRMSVNKEYLETGIGISEGQSRTLREAYLRVSPGLEIWWDQVKSLAYKSPRVMSTCHGRTHQFLGAFDDHMWNEMVSYEPQASVADNNTISIIEAHRELQRIDPEVVCFAHTHDGGFFQLREEAADEACQIVKRCMTREMIVDRIPLTIPVEVKRGCNWGSMEKVHV